MEKIQSLYHANQYHCIKDYIWEGIQQYSKNIAFRIKDKKEKVVKYKDITYAQFGQQIKQLGTGLLKLGLKGKRIAIIGKNCYEWALTYTTTLNGVGVTVPLDKGLPEQEIESLLQRSFADAIVFESSYLEIMNRIHERNNT